MEQGGKQNNALNPQRNSSPSPQGKIKKAIGVTSAKGGTGRSFIASLLALELHSRGYEVGILDANFSGSSIARMFGLKGPVEMGVNSFVPLQTGSGIKVLSADLLVDEDKNPVIWKEALSGKVIESLYQEVEWGSLDYLIIDLPIATTETAVTILQTVPFEAVLFVNTPQELCSWLNAKGMRIVNQFGIQIGGIVENMTYPLDLGSGSKAALFSAGITDSLASSYDLPILARIPYISENCLLSDSGRMEEVHLKESAEFFENFTIALLQIKERTGEAVTLETNKPGAEKSFPGQNAQEASPSVQETSASSQYFSDIVMHLIRQKANMGALENPDAQGLFLGQCGDRMQIDLKIINNRILDAKFLVDGCGATLACGSMITRMACSKTLEEAEKINADQLITALDGLPEDHLHCAELAVMTLREALIDAVEGHRNRV